MAENPAGHGGIEEGSAPTIDGAPAAQFAPPQPGAWPANGATGAYPSVQQGGYGYPQPGYAPPGYPQQSYPPPGYPQQTYPQQNVPPQQFPQQPGYPQQPAGHPMPGAPGYPGYPQAAPKKGLSGGAIAGIIAGVVILAAIAGVTVMLTSSSGPNGKTLAKKWSVPASGSSDRLVGSWLTGTTLVRASSAGGAVAYNLSDGSKAWTVTPPSGGSVPCAMSPTVTAGGIGTIAFGADANSCTVLAGVDSASGKILWTVPLMTGDHTVAMSAQTYIQGSVATLVSGDRAGGLDVTTGKQVWGYQARGQYCNETDKAASGIVLVDDYCADASPSYTLSAMDGTTGKLLWRKTETDHTNLDNVLSANPLVAAVSSSSGGTTVNVYDASGNPKPLNTSGVHLNTLSFQNSNAIMLSGQTLVVQTSEDQNSSANSTAGKVVAYNLTTGDPLWTYNGESQHGAVLVNATTPDGKLYALSTGSYDGSPHLVSLDPATGKSTVLSALPSGTDGWSFSSGTLFTTPDGMLISLSEYTSGDSVDAYK